MRRYLLSLLLLTACDGESGDAADAGPVLDTGPGADTTVVEQDVTLTPPARGWQIDIPAFEVPVGVEMQDCYFFRIPEDPARPGEDRFFNRFEVVQNPGTHHMNLFRVATETALRAEDGGIVRGDTPDSPCWKSSNWAEWPIIINSQESSLGDTVDWTLPAGVATRFAPGELIMLQTHYVNADTQQSTLHRGKVIVNLHEIAPEEMQQEMGTIFTTNQNLRICPGETKSFQKTCNFARDREVTVIAANGHFHSRGRRFTIAPFDAATGEAGATFYESTVWDDPPMARDLDLTIPVGGGVEYACEFHAPEGSCGDPDDDCCFNFGGRVEFQEHCNAFLYYFPKIEDGGCF